ncbi:MAG: hypothetical protein AAGK32_04855, partial [Actinomycetota bacterium]
MTGGRWRLLVRALAAAIAALTLLIGVPAALVAAVGNPLPTAVPAWSELGDAVSGGRIEPMTQIKALAVVAWLAWANLAASFGLEVLAAIRGGRARAVRPLAATQWLAARLVGHLALVGSVMANSSVPAGALPPLPTAAASMYAEDGSFGSGGTIASVGSSEIRSAAGADAATGGAEIGVRRLDTLWSLSEAHLGSGEQWRLLRDANVGRVMADGTKLSSDFTQIEKGWSLVLPAAVTDQAAAIEVRAGDTLWDLSEDRLRGAEQAAAPAQIVDYLDAVIDRNEAMIDDPDLIYPGQVFAFPAPTDEAEGPDPVGAAEAPADPSGPGPLG